MNARLGSSIYAVILVLLASAVPAFAAPVKALPASRPAQTKRISVRGGDIILKVRDFEAAREMVQSQARRHSAELQDSQTVVNAQGKKSGWLLLRMDARELDALIGDIRPVGKLYSERVQTTDQTAEYETLGRRIGLLAKNEQELLGFMHRPRQMRGSDILYVQDRLYQSRVEASDAAQSQIGMERAAQRSALRISLFEPEPKQNLDWGNWRATASYRAKTSATLLIGRFVTAVYFVVWFAPIWIPSALVFFFAGRYLVRRIRAQLAADTQEETTAKQ